MKQINEKIFFNNLTTSYQELATFALGSVKK